jgi:hypothetical protein
LTAIPRSGRARKAANSPQRTFVITAAREICFASVFAYAEAGAELLRLHEGDALTIQGEGRLIPRRGKDGTYLSATYLRVLADHVVALRQQKRPETPAPQQSQPIYH